MKLSLVFRAAAQKEFETAAVWYEARRVGLGAEFIHEIEQTLDRISKQPDRFPKVLGDVREAPARRFPYCVYYRLKPQQIVIIAVFHSSRDPTDWQSRA